MSSALTLGHTCDADARLAVRAFCRQVAVAEISFVLFFTSAQYDLSVVADEMKTCLGDIPAVGCTTAGEIGPAGHSGPGIVGVGFPRDSFTIECGLLADLATTGIGSSAASDMVQTLMQRLEARVILPSAANTFALLLIDGLSGREEAVTHALHRALGEMALIGGSAGDGLRFREASVYYDGAFLPSAAVVLLIHTTLPFMTFKVEHYAPTAARLVVTEADPARRLVRELNGLPAAAEYARMANLDESRLEPAAFATTPVVVQIDGANYVRSIRQVHADGGLTFYCAIEEGVVLRVARARDLVAGLGETLNGIAARIGPPQLILGCDCILRKLEIEQQGLTGVVAELYRRHNVVGFNTYGEQYGGLHVNQTLVGVAFGAERGESEADHA